MPNSELGLADVSVRLRSLCRRVNTFTALHAGAVCLAVLLAGLALRFALGPQRFGALPAGLGLLAFSTTVAWALLFVRRHWLIPGEAARLADRQAALDERLTTLLALGDSSIGNRLLPLLVAQALDLGDRWQPDRLLPRAYPRSVYVAAAALLALLAAPLIEPALPPAPILAPEPNPAAESATDGSSEGPNDPIQLASRTGQTDPADPRDGGKLDAVALAPGDADPDAGDGQGRPEKEKATDTSPIAAQASRSQPSTGSKPSAQVKAPPRSLRGTGVDAGESASDGGNNDGGSDAKNHPNESKQDKASRRDAERDDRRGDGRDGGLPKEQGGAAADAKPAEIPPDPRSAAGQRAAAAQPGSQADPTGDRPPPSEQGAGGAPNASGGSEMLTLGKDADPDGPAVGSFRLTLSSFLDEIEQHDPAPDSTPAPPRAAAPERPPPALAERSTHDDVVHQTSIPPAYQDIVKRIYSRSQRP